MFRVIVCGDRRLADYGLVRSHLDRLLAGKLPDVVVIHGAATGADSLAARYAAERGLACVAFPADWRLHKKAAGPIRNQRMIDEGKPQACVAFDGGGRGTADMLSRARGYGLLVRVMKVQLPKE